MKKCSSVVWRFFDRIQNDNHRCVAVLCKLCDTQYKFFGNTTNLRAHLINKHPLQWELSQNTTFEEASFRVEDEEPNQSPIPKRRKYNKNYKDKNVRYSVSVDKARNLTGERIPKIEIHRVDVLDNSEVENDQTEAEENEATLNLVRQLHNSQGSDEEWLEEPYGHIPTYETKKVKYRRIKREITTPPRRISKYNPHKSPYETASPMFLEASTSKDEYSVFGEYVANKLRKVKSQRTKGNLQQLITTILWQAEYGAYDNADSVKRVLLYTTQEAEHDASANVHDPGTEVTIELPVQHEETNQSVEESNQSLEMLNE